MYALIAVILIGVLIAVAAAQYLRRRLSHKTCANCGSPAQFGYSHEAESELEDILNLCFTCLVRKLTDDYGSYEGRAVVLQPAAGFPCYVFQSSSRWPDSKLAREVAELFSATDEACNQCGSNAHYLCDTRRGRHFMPKPGRSMDLHTARSDNRVRRRNFAAAHQHIRVRVVQFRGGFGKSK